METLLIPNKEILNNKIEQIKEDGADSIQVVSDFDKTLTTAFIEGKKIMSTYAILREMKYLSPDYAKKAFALFDKYHPYEIATDLSFEERRKKMDEWWDEHLKLMIKSGINRGVFIDIAQKNYVRTRKGLKKFVALLNENKIPLLIFSAGLGDMIREVLKKNNLLKDNIKIIANFFKFDKDGKVSIDGYEHDIVHVFNKNTISHDEDISERKNVILLGDNLDDLGMIKGITYDTLLKIGFLNEKIEERKEEYMKNFDITIVGDGSLDEVNKIFEKILL